MNKAVVDRLDKLSEKLDQNNLEQKEIVMCLGVLAGFFKIVGVRDGVLLFDTMYEKAADVPHLND